MCTNEANPHLTDNKIYLFHVEYQVRCVVTDLVVHKGNTNNKPPMCLEAKSRYSISLDDVEMACSYCQREAGRRWKFLGRDPLECRKMPF